MILVTFYYWKNSHGEIYIMTECLMIVGATALFVAIPIVVGEIVDRLVKFGLQFVIRSL